MKPVELPAPLRAKPFERAVVAFETAILNPIQEMSRAVARLAPGQLDGETRAELEQIGDRAVDLQQQLVGLYVKIHGGSPK